MNASTFTPIPEASASGMGAYAETTRTTPATRRPLLLDLFCGGGGASAGYYAAGFDIVGVDIQPQPHYPFPFIHADALTVDLTGFDVIHASPPCQAYSCATPTSRRHHHPDLLAPIRQRLQHAVATGQAWAYVIENVPGAPMHHPITICGDTLRLGVRRHRLFESNLPLTGTRCWHDRTTPPIPVYGTYGQRARRNPHDLVEGETSLEEETSLGDRETSPSTTQRARDAMGIDWLPWPALTQAIPPAYTHWIGIHLLTHQPRDDSPELCPSVTPTTGADDSSHPNRHAAAQTSPPDQTHRVATNTGDETRRREPSHDDPVPNVTSDATPPAAFRHCRCGNPLPPRPPTGRWPRHCSHACRQAAYRARINARPGARS